MNIEEFFKARGKVPRRTPYAVIDTDWSTIFYDYPTGEWVFTSVKPNPDMSDREEEISRHVTLSEALDKLNEYELAMIYTPGAPFYSEDWEDFYVRVRHIIQEGKPPTDL